MKQKVFRILTVLLLALASAPQLTLMHSANAQGGLNFRALGVDNEARQIGSLLDAQAKFFKKALGLRAKVTILPAEKTQLSAEAIQRKADVATLQSGLQSLINKLKQGNHWDETFDAQVLASLQNANARSALTQFGGARRLFETALGEVNSLRQEIDDEVSRVEGGSIGSLRTRGDRILAAHAKPAMGKLRCSFWFYGYTQATLVGWDSLACVYGTLYNEKGCQPKLTGLACD